MSAIDNQAAFAASAGDAHHGNDHPDFLAHHFDTPTQQFEAGKLGMWLFIATELLLFGGLFCAYAVYRANHPELFQYGSQFLDTKWGAINTVILILSSLTMAAGVSAAQMGKRNLLIGLLALTFLGGLGFMCIKYVEYKHKFEHNIVWGTKFYVDPHAEQHAVAHDDQAEHHADAEHGRELWAANCLMCHGAGGEGVPSLGRDIRRSEWVAQQTDEQLVEFITEGRQVAHPRNFTGIPMPARGGNPKLTDDDLLDIVAHVRTLTSQATAETASHDASDASTVESSPEIDEVTANATVIEPAPPGPAGLARLPDHEAVDDHHDDHATDDAHAVHQSVDPNRPANAHIFFGIYFVMTGLHGIHVLAGMTVIAWLILGAARGRFSAAYFTPVDLGGLYWHVVDLIWIFLFPLLYLIH